MPHRGFPARLALPFGWSILAGLALMLGLAGPAAAADGYGNCKVTGQKGAYHIHPVVPGQLTVEVTLPAPGWYDGDTPATIKAGFEYCMGADIAYRAGLDKLVLVNVAWPQLIGGHTKNFDLALAEASITPARKKVVDFSVPYFDSDIGLLVKKETKIDSASAKTLRIGAHQGTTGADFVMDVLKPTKPVKVYPTVPGMMAALAAGQIDAAADDTAYVLAYAAKSHGSLVVAGQYRTGETYGAVYPKGSADEAVFNKIIQSLKDDGTLQALATTYLAKAWGADPTKVPYFTP
jgi:polar amino acid transport system substrate-binding protein